MLVKMTKGIQLGIPKFQYCNNSLIIISVIVEVRAPLLPQTFKKTFRKLKVFFDLSWF